MFVQPAPDLPEGEALPELKDNSNVPSKTVQ